MRIVKTWINDDYLASVALFEDNTRFFCREKSAYLVDENGNILNEWWKEEPTGGYRTAFANRDSSLDLLLTDEHYDAISDTFEPYASRSRENIVKLIGQFI